MESVLKIGRIWVSTLARIRQKPADPADFFGIARLRILTCYTIFSGLVRELSLLSLQRSVMIMRTSVGGMIQLKATDVVKMEAALRRAVAKARTVMTKLHTRPPVQEKSMR